MTRYLRTLAVFALLVSSGTLAQTTFNRFEPANGVLKGSTSTYVTTPAQSSDIVAMWTGTCTGTNVLQANGVCGTGGGGGGTPANPTASLGLTAINGSLTTYMRSDAAPALSQSIVPTWTGAHSYTADLFSTHGVGFNLTAQANIARIAGISAGSQSMNVLGARNANAAGYSTIRLVNDAYIPGAFGIPTTGACCDDSALHQFVIAFFGSTALGGSVFNGLPTGESAYIGTEGPADFWMGTFAHGNMQIRGSNGTFMFNPTASHTDDGMTVFGYPAGGAYTLNVSATNTPGSSNGVLIKAGGNSTDNSLIVQDATGFTTWFWVRGDGRVTSKAPAQMAVQNMQSGGVGGWSLTATGFATDPVNINSGITQMGGITCIRFNPTTATSNATTFTVTGFPTGMTGTGEGVIWVEDNGTVKMGSWSYSAGTITFYAGAPGTAFTATGTKGLPGVGSGQTICMQAN